MRLIATVSAAAVLMAAASAKKAKQCSETEAAMYKTLDDIIPLTCLNFIHSFEICTDDCFERVEAAYKTAPDCVVGDQSVSRLESATAFFTECQDARKSNANKYTPHVARDAPECSIEQYLEWTDKYGGSKPFSKCESTSTIDETCTDECLKILEEGVAQAPACREIGEGSYTMAELKKGGLVQCLKVRKADLATNVVLQTVAGGSGGAAITTATTPSSTSAAPAATPASAAAGVVGVASTVTVLAVAGFLLS